MKERYTSLDGIKAIAIIAVVFYHMGFLKYGYLGVDVFFVIAGFLTTKSISNKIQNDSFSYKSFLYNRFKRLMPLVFVAGFICLLIGYIGMLPDDYENLTESIVASNLASNNILAVLTTGNYWDVVNDYKPLMHLWYVGVLVEFYILWPLVMIGLDKIYRIVARRIINQGTLKIEKVFGGVLRNMYSLVYRKHRPLQSYGYEVLLSAIQIVGIYSWGYRISDMFHENG